MKNPPVIDRLVNTLFPEEPVLNINDDSDASEAYWLERARAKAQEEYDSNLELSKRLSCIIPGMPSEDQLRVDANRLRAENAHRVQEAKRAAERFQQDRHSKHQPLTEVEALWRIERAILRVAHALEASNDRD